MRGLIAMGLMAMGGLLASAPALAQGGANSSVEILPQRLPNQRPADAANTDGRARASAEVIAVIVAAQRQPARVMQAADAARIRDLMLLDGRLDEAEIDLLDELTASAIRAITITPAKGGEPIVTGTVSGDTLRVLEAPLEQRYRAMWDAADPVSGWAALLREARRSDPSHGRVRKFLVTMTHPAARDSTAANTYEPARTLLSAFSRRNEQQPPADRTLGRRLQYEAFVDGDYLVGGRLPDFLYAWLK